jgi:hypothetical protein
LTYTKNPRGWFNDPTIDVTTPAGLDNFASRLIAYAHSSVAVAQGMNAQGLLTWDIEGEQTGWPNYMGDPSMATTLAPELAYNNVVDSYFQIFRDAGLRVGVTVRPQQLVNVNGQWQQQTVADPTQVLLNKISYAKQHWGCTIFYIDSFDGFTDGSVLQRVQAANPDVLLIPESANVRDDAYSAPYVEIFNGYTAPPADATATYPGVFSVVNAFNGDMSTHVTDMTADVQRGDILMFHGWYPDPNNTYIAQAYLNAGAAHSQLVQSQPMPSPMFTLSALPPDPGDDAASLLA